MLLIKQSSTAKPLVFFMYDSTDHITGKTGLSPTVTISKNGGSFASPSGAVTEIGNGFYKVAGNATDSNTLGTLALNATATGADQCPMGFCVVAFDPDTVAVGAMVSYTQPTGFLAADFTRLDASITSRLASASYSAPDNSGISGIKAKTDLLNFTGTAGMLLSQSTNMRGTDGALLSISYSAPDNAGIAAIISKTDQLNFTGVAGMLKSESTNAALASVWTSASLTAILDALVKVQAASYDSASVVGDVITLSNGKTQTVTVGGRVTSP